MRMVVHALSPATEGKGEASVGAATDRYSTAQYGQADAAYLVHRPHPSPSPSTQIHRQHPNTIIHLISKEQTASRSRTTL